MTVCIIFNGETVTAFLLMSGIRQGYLLSPLQFSVVVEALARAVRQEKERKDIRIRKCAGY